MVSDHHQNALRKKVKLTELEEEKFIGFCEQTFPGRKEAIRQACEGAGFAPCIEQQAHNLSAPSRSCPRQGVTLMPDDADHLPHPHAVFLTLQPPCPRRFPRWCGERTTVARSC